MVQKILSKSASLEGASGGTAAWQAAAAFGLRGRVGASWRSFSKRGYWCPRLRSGSPSPPTWQVTFSQTCIPGRPPLAPFQTSPGFPDSTRQEARPLRRSLHLLRRETTRCKCPNLPRRSRQVEKQQAGTWRHWRIRGNNCGGKVASGGGGCRRVVMKFPETPWTQKNLLRHELRHGGKKTKKGPR